MPSALPGQITLPTRQELIDRYILDYLNRDPDGDRDDPQLQVDAAVFVDAILPLYANQRVIGSNAVLEDATGDAALQWGEREGVGPPLAASGSSGFVIIDASSGGATYANGATLTDDDTGLKYAIVLTTSTQLLHAGDEPAVQAVSTGAQTNIAGGKQLTWDEPPGGSGPKATVATNTDGSGLTNGREDETIPAYVLRIRAEKADRSRMSNDADYRRAVRETPGVRVLEAFTWPCINGTGSTAAAALLPPAQPGGSRVPSEAQRVLVESYVTGQMPADDGSFFPVMVEQNADIAYRVAWAPEASGWADVNPWPLYYTAAGTPGAVVVNTAADATHFTLKTANGDYTGVRQPVVGQTIAFYNQAGGAFSKKRILTVGGAGPWTIVADTTDNGSDTTYVPIAGQRAMPWSESLPRLLSGLFAYFDGLGPGEMTNTFYDAGRRQRRQPQPPREWPNVLTTKGLEDAIEIEDVLDRSVVEGAGLTTTVGAGGVIVYQLRLRWVSVFPL